MTVRLPQGPNWVLLALSLTALATLWGLEIITVAANRIVAGEGRYIWQALGWSGACLASLPILCIAWLSLAKPAPFSGKGLPTSACRQVLQLAAVVLLLIMMPIGLIKAISVADISSPAARIGIGAGFWAVFFLAMMMLIELRLKLSLSRLTVAALLGGVCAVWWLAAGGWLDQLALIKEYSARDAAFHQAVQEHLLLVSVAVTTSLVLGVATALLIRRYQASRQVAFALLNFFQTVPSIALFGLMLAPLAWLSSEVPLANALGIKGIGFTPALLALILYSLLPMVRNTYMALESVNPDVLEAADGMGMRQSQRFWQVRVPLALPILIEGVRITTVQAVGLTAVAALIGAGGLGTFIFQGLGQAAMDMVLLGALPILVMALVVDVLLGAWVDWLRKEPTA